MNECLNIVWTPYGRTWHEFNKAGLAKAGTLIEYSYLHRDGSEMTDTIMIGDINEGGGACDHCMLFGVHDSDSIVVRYAALWVKPS